MSRWERKIRREKALNHRKIMSVEIKNVEVLEAQHALLQLVQMELPNLTALKVVRIARAVDAEAESIAAVRNRILGRYTAKDEDGKALPVKDAEGKIVEGQVRLADPEAFRAEVEELFAGKTTLKVERLRVEELGKDCKITPRVLLGLGPLLAEEAEEPQG